MIFRVPYPVANLLLWTTTNTITMAFALNVMQLPFVMASQGNVPLLSQQATRNYFSIFLEGQPKALGTIQIVMAFIQICLGVILYIISFFYYVNFTMSTFIPFWAPSLFIISGSVAIAAENDGFRSNCLIGGCLTTNIVSSLASALELCLLLTDITDFKGECDYTNQPPCSTLNVTWMVRIVVLVSLIIASLLEFCVAITISSFGCRSLSYKSVVPLQSERMQIVVIPNECWAGNVAPSSSQALKPNSAPTVPQYPLTPTNQEDQKGHGKISLSPPVPPPPVYPALPEACSQEQGPQCA